MLEIKIKSDKGTLPKYETEGAAGMDISANLDKDIVLMPGERKLIPTGLYVEIPNGYEIQIRARSGLAIKFGITLVNGIGTIDSDYRGEIKVPIINLGHEDFIIKDKDRIAQMVVARYEKINWVEVSKLEETKRSQGGFGHTGR